MKLARKTISASLSVAALGAMLVAAPEASATSSGGSCVGSLISASPIIEDQGNNVGSTLGYLNVYWDGSTGENCAILNSASSDWGQTKWMAVQLFEKGNPSNSQTDANYYKYYAGPISVPGAGRCIYADGTISLETPGVATSGYAMPGPFC
ncbi:MAG TPA: hypothetical protein VFN97_21420 [Actinospica sp.]|nr:hypothetical protein [Actinospica sp.]